MFKIILTILFILVISCESDEDKVINTIAIEGRYVENGTIKITKDSRIILFWDVIGDDNYLYLYGIGTIDTINQTFSINLDNPPPEKALFRNTFGLAYFMITNDLTLSEGRSSDSKKDFENCIGISGDNILFYSKQNNFDYGGGWDSNFDKGYSLGEAVFKETGHDDIKEINNQKIKITVDDFNNIDIVNWY